MLNLEDVEAFLKEIKAESKSVCRPVGVTPEEIHDASSRDGNVHHHHLVSYLVRVGFSLHAVANIYAKNVDILFDLTVELRSLISATSTRFHSNDRANESLKRRSKKRRVRRTSNNLAPYGDHHPHKDQVSK